ncbi:MAG: hypothetical protein FJ291_11045 [Planctomycetes bacterium]|nr:hypothetical protein [Planctomycetota bacterium]
MRQALVLTTAALLAAMPGVAAQPPSVLFHRVPGNLVKNASFEHNWFNRRFADNRRFLLLSASDMGVGECDGHIDHWRVQAPLPEAWDTSVARVGSRSLRFDKPGQASQLVRFAGEQHWRAGGAHYAMFLPMEERLADQLAKRPIVVGAWCKTEDVPKGAEPQLTAAIECAVRRGPDSVQPVAQGRNQRSVAFSGGTHDWEYKEVRFDVGLDPELDPERLKGTPHWLTVGLVARGGTVWFDDPSCVEQPGGTGVHACGPANAGFEALDKEGWPEGWSKPALWTWFRNDYYTWTGWSHHDAKAFRGGAVSDRMLAFSGNASLRFTVFPGDNFAVESAPIALNQDKPRPLEVRAMVKADNLRTLEIMAKDEAGQWLPQGDFLGDDMEEPGSYNFGTTGAGTYDWCCVRKYFSPRKPVKTLRLFLCARGFDGRIVEKNIVGTAWLDDIALFQHGTVGGASLPRVPTQPTDAPRRYPFKVVDLDFGDRLCGKNTLRAIIEFDKTVPLEQMRHAGVAVSVRSPSGKAAGKDMVILPGEIVQKPTEESPRGYLVGEASYEVAELCKSWEEQCRLSLWVIAGEPTINRVPCAEFSFGTPSKLVEAGVSGYCFYPDEQPVAFASLNVARGSFPELARCEFVLNGKTTIGEVTDLSEILKPQKAPDYINTRNLAQVKLKSEGFKVHPWSAPVLDNAVAVRVRWKEDAGQRRPAYNPDAGQGRPAYNPDAGQGRPAYSTEPIRFGFMERPPKAEFPEKIEKTAVNERGFITINGQPYLPVYWTPHFGIRPEVNYPPMQFKLKAVDLTSIVYAKERMPDGEVKAKLLAKVNEVKTDPKLFQYEIGEGEMQLQDAGWKERVEWCKKAIGWIREADPNHLIAGPSSWLVGHPGHNEAMKAFVPDWDVIGVEASFKAVPEISKVLGPLMDVGGVSPRRDPRDGDIPPTKTRDGDVPPTIRAKRRTAVIVGLETYFYVPNETLRWRGYKSIVNGATGIGLCPSGMMQSRPDKVNYLRGLNGEFRGLAPILAADEPKEKLSVAPPVETLERVFEGKRYVIALRTDGASAPLKARFGFPKGFRCSSVKVRFEARTIQPAAEGFDDDFRTPRTVHVYELTP